jgi:hypothetical protein
VCNITELLGLERFSADSCGVVNDRSHQTLQLRVFYVLPALTTTFVAARMLARLKLAIGLGADDWVMVGALGAYLADVGTGHGIAVQGFGQHTYYLSTCQITKALQVG